MKSVVRATFQGGLRIVSELLSCLDKLSASVKKKKNTHFESRTRQ